MPLQHFTLLMAVGKKSGLVWKGLQQHHEAHLIAEFRVSTFESAAHLVGMAKEPAAEPFRSRPPMLVRRREEGFICGAGFVLWRAAHK
jgi:hypothetical protein